LRREFNIIPASAPCRSRSGPLGPFGSGGTGAPAFFAHRARAARRAMSRRCSGLKFRIRAFPPRRPNSTASESFCATISSAMPRSSSRMLSRLQGKSVNGCSKPWRARFAWSSGMTITTRSNLQPVRTCYRLELATGCELLLKRVLLSYIQSLTPYSPPHTIAEALRAIQRKSFGRATPTPRAKAACKSGEANRGPLQKGESSGENCRQEKPKTKPLRRSVRSAVQNPGDRGASLEVLRRRVSPSVG